MKDYVMHYVLLNLFSLPACYCGSDLGKKTQSQNFSTYFLLSTLLP